MNRELCSICLEKYQSILSVRDTDNHGIKWFTKLQFIVPELEWFEEYLVCKSCIEQLEKAWEFKKRILNLEVERRLGLLSRETLSEEINDLRDESDTECYYQEEEITCKDCSKVFTTQTQFRQHKLQFHNADNLQTLAKNPGVFNNGINNLFTCNECGVGFITKENLLSHIQNEQSEKFCSNKAVLEKFVEYDPDIKACMDHICSGCDKKFATESKLNEHFKLCKKFECCVCKESFNSKKALIAHLKFCKSNVRKSKSTYQCNSCKNFYATEKNLNLHKIWCTREKKLETTSETIIGYDCYICTLKFDSVEEYNTHNSLKHNAQKESKSESNGKRKKSSRPAKTFTCEVCSAEFSYVRLVVEHCTSEHSMEKKCVKAYSCDKCDMRFASSANLDQHRYYHEKKRTHVCSLCGKGFITKSDLTVHEYTHYNRRNYKCNKCDKAFNTNKNLRTHNLVVHTDRSLWKYGCFICEKRFPLKTNYDQHLRRHTGEKEHVCHICKKSFISKSEMRRHINLHSNIKAFKCANCDKEYKERRTYEAHLTRVHGIGNAKIPIREKKFVCHICPSQFYDKQKLSKHLCSHSGLKPFPCYMCDKKFTDKSYLKHHLKTVHNVESVKIGLME